MLAGITMQITASVTQKGQITIPQEFRKALNIELYGKVKLKLKKDRIIVQPTEDLLEIAGKVKPRTNATKDPVKARELLEEKYERI